MDDPGLQWRTVAVLHTCVGLVVPELRRPLLEMVSRGWVATAAVKGEAGKGQARPVERMNAMWFHLAGALMWLLGWVLSDMVAATGGPLPAAYGWFLVAMGVVFGLAQPVSGIWFAVLIGGNIVRLA